MIGPIPRSANIFINTITKYSYSNLGLSLYHRGLELLRWIYEAAAEANFVF